MTNEKVKEIEQRLNEIEERIAQRHRSEMFKEYCGLPCVYKLRAEDLGDRVPPNMERCRSSCFNNEDCPNYIPTQPRREPLYNQLTNGGSSF